MRFDNPSQPVDRQCAALGIKGANADWIDANGAVALTSGTVRYGYIPLVAGDVVSAVHVWLTQTAATVTTIKGGLYSYSGTTGTLCAASANDTGAFNAVGMATLTMATPYTVPTTGNYLIAILSVATTPGSILSMATSGVAGKWDGSIKPGAVEASQTDLDASSTLGNTTVSIWCGWS